MLGRGRGLRWAAHSDAGDRRTENQDCLFAACDWFGRRRVGLFAVADGCGGMQCGAQASRRAIQAVQEFWEARMPGLLRPVGICQAEVQAALEDMMQAAHDGVSDLGGAGGRAASTLTVLLVIGRFFWVKHVGDCRLYALRDGTLRLLTEDQTALADMLRNREITAAQAAAYNRSVLSMCLGGAKKLHTYTRAGKLGRGEVFCLCSDGFYAFVPPEELAACLAQAPQDAGRLRALIEPGQAEDNVSILTVWEE